MVSPVRVGSVIGGFAASYEEACKVLGCDPPKTTEECASFAARSMKGAKTKAELYAKVGLVHASHSEALDWVAQICCFKDRWHGFSEYVKQFPQMRPQDRDNDVRSFGLALAAWVLNDDLVETYDVCRTFVRLLRVLTTGLAGDEEGGEFVMRRVFFVTDYSPEKRIGYSAEQVASIFEELIGWEPSRYVTKLLQRVPVRGGKAGRWPALDTLTVGELLGLPLANIGSNAGFGYRGWEHAVASMIDPLEQWASITDSRRHYSAAIWRAPESEGERTEIGRAKAPSSRLALRLGLDSQLGGVSKLPVSNVITVRPGENGFFSQLFSGTPEQIEEAFKAMSFGGEGIRRVVFKEAFGQEYLLSILRHRYWRETADGANCYDAQVVLHDLTGALVAQVSLVLSIVPFAYDWEDFVSHLDSTNDNDVQELALTVVNAAIDDNAFPECEHERLLFIRDWEVRQQDRGRGLGVEFLKAACTKAFKGLPGPTAVVAKLWPLQLVPSCREASLGIPEIEGPVNKLKAYWNSKVVRGGVLPKSAQVHLEAGHFDLMQGRDSCLELAAIGGCHHRVRNWA